MKTTPSKKKTRADAEETTRHALVQRLHALRVFGQLLRQNANTAQRRVAQQYNVARIADAEAAIRRFDELHPK